jgi:hypothetical protein
MDKTTFRNKIDEIRNDLRKVREAFEEDYIIRVADVLKILLDSVESSALECNYGDKELIEAVREYYAQNCRRR